MGIMLVCVCVYIYIYIYIQRERERELENVEKKKREPLIKKDVKATKDPTVDQKKEKAKFTV